MNESNGVDQRKPLYNRGFSSLLVTQFLGATNDNVMKQVLMFMVIAGGVWSGQLGPGGQGYISIGLTLPFILFSGYGGWLSDRVSKTRVAQWMKIAEIPIAITAGVGLLIGNLYLALAAFVALAVQSTFFGPAKYGVIPELVDNRDLSRANGAINMLTNIAAILGTLIAGPVADLYFPPKDPVTGVQPDGIRWLPLAVLLTIAILGYVASRFLPKLSAKDPQVRFDPNPISTYWRSLVEMSKTPLLGIALAWAYFYLIGLLALLILPDYKDFLGISATKASVLYAVLAVSIGVGSAVAGYVSGDRIEPRLIRYGGIGLAIFCGLLGFVMPHHVGSDPNTYIWVVAAFLVGAGFAAGCYIVPLQALIQDLAPDDARGRFLGTTNALSFVFMTFAGVLYPILRGKWIGLEANRVFLVCAGLSVIGILFALLKMKSIRQAIWDHVREREAEHQKSGK